MSTTELEERTIQKLCNFVGAQSVAVKGGLEQDRNAARATLEVAVLSIPIRATSRSSRMVHYPELTVGTPLSPGKFGLAET